MLLLISAMLIKVKGYMQMLPHIWTHVDFSQENSIEKTIVAEQGHKK